MIKRTRETGMYLDESTSYSHTRTHTERERERLTHARALSSIFGACRLHMGSLVRSAPVISANSEHVDHRIRTHSPFLPLGKQLDPDHAFKIFLRNVVRWCPWCLVVVWFFPTIRRNWSAECNRSAWIKNISIRVPLRVFWLRFALSHWQDAKILSSHNGNTNMSRRAERYRYTNMSVVDECLIWTQISKVCIYMWLFCVWLLGINR